MGSSVRRTNDERFSKKSSLRRMCSTWSVPRCVCNSAGVGQFAVFLAVFKAEGKSLDAARAQRRHVGRHHTGVDAAAQERPDGHVADHAQGDAFAQQRGKLVFSLALVDVQERLVRHIPVPHHLRGTSCPAHEVPRGELAHTLEHRQFAGHIAIAHEEVDRCERRSNGAIQCKEQRLDLGGKAQLSVGHRVVERLDAEPVSSQEDVVPLGVIQREGEHAAEMVDAFLAVLLVGVDDHLGVGVGPKHVASPFQIGAHGLVVEDLAVEHDQDRLVLV